MNINPAEIRPLQTGRNSVTTVTVQTNPFVSGLSVTWNQIRLAGTGGHQPNHPLPDFAVEGSFATAPGTTDSTGEATTTYTAQVFSGEYRIEAKIQGLTKQGPIKLRIMVPGLVQLVEGPNSNFDLIGIDLPPLNRSS